MADHGGARLGTPGKTYANRTDLNAQPIRTATGQTYGEATRQENAQRAMPLAQVNDAPPDPTGGLYAPGGGDPVTSGLAQGPGEAPAFGGLSDADIIEALARRFPGFEGLDRLWRGLR